VTYTQGAPPNLFMKDASDETIEEVGVSNWKTEHIEEYLQEKLAQDA
jgi:diketogulonate reductase-like aldo/keto reductase